MSARPSVSPDALARAVARATDTIAPCWPLARFVAVNPFLGVTDRPFHEAARTLARAAGARLTLPRSFYAAELSAGRIADRHLAAALAEAPRSDGVPTDVEALRRLAAAGDDQATLPLTPTVADLAADLTGHDWARAVTERLSAWAGSYFDEGQAGWANPWRALTPYAAWRAEAMVDRTPELLGAAGCREVFAGLPATAEALTARAVARLGLTASQLEPYFHRLLMQVGGWAAYARHRGWERALRGESDDTVAELLAIRLAWEVALLELFGERGVARAWAVERARLGAPRAAPAAEAALAADLLLQAAYEKARQEELLGLLAARPSIPAAPGRPAVQAAFCIDVRSEVFRRALEGVAPEVETIGFAGFFGFPIELVPLGEGAGGAQCPALVAPRAVIAEEVPGAAEAGIGRRLRLEAKAVWKRFKTGAVSCFSFVGPLGLFFAPKLVTDALGLTRPVPHPGSAGMGRGWQARRRPVLSPGTVGERAAGLPLEAQVDLAEGALRGMGLVTRTARLVLLAGHGAQTVNNPHAAGLHCGACGGHSGEGNARVAAAVLNDPRIRAALGERGISLPADTVFVPALHATTTDDVTLFDLDLVPATHREEVARLQERLAAASSRARAWRAPRLGLDAGAPVDAAIRARSRDWSEVRPEWGLAGCAAFIAAPRHHTAGVDLGGRAFLHSYDHREDPDGRVLELILTAPTVVGSWISLQYYASAVAPAVFGSGNKTLHNVVGAVGVLEGNGGDLRVGLPWQSVHDGERLAHEPVRLSVIVAAPCAAVNGVIARHEHLRHLLDHGWMHLYAMDDQGVVTHRYTGGLTWRAVVAGAAAERAA